MAYESDRVVPEHDLMSGEDAKPRTQTRRAMLGGVAVAGGSASFAGRAMAASLSSPSSVFDFIATQEGFGVTFLSEAIRRAPGTPSAQFVPVLKSAVTAEFDHLRALERLGHSSQVRRYWIPDALFGDGGPGLFDSIMNIETIEISMYLVGVTSFTRARNEFRSRLCAEALGTECEHRVAARTALMMLGATTEPPNNVGFERYDQRSIPRVKAALEGLGIGYDKPGAQPGQFYEYPGDPLTIGTGLPLSSNVPK